MKIVKHLVLFVAIGIFASNYGYSLPLKYFGPQDSLRTNCMVADIVFICDWSESMKIPRNQIINAIGAFTSKLNLTEDGTKIGIITFTDFAVVRLPLTTDESLLKTTLDSLGKDTSDGSTALAPSLVQVSSLFSVSYNERSLFNHFLWEAYQVSKIFQDPKIFEQYPAYYATQNSTKPTSIVIFISDGVSYDIDEKQALLAAKSLKDKGTILCTIGIGKMIEVYGTEDPIYTPDYGQKFLQSLASDGYYFGTEPESLLETMTNLRITLCRF